MEEMFQTLMSNPYVSIGVPAIIFLIALILILKRIPGLIWTAILIFVMAYTGFMVWGHPAVQESMGREHDPKMNAWEKMQEIWECFSSHFKGDHDHSKDNGEMNGSSSNGNAINEKS